MTIYGISQEVFSCQVYAGDPGPERKLLRSTERGDLYNLTAFSIDLIRTSFRNLVQTATSEHRYTGKRSQTTSFIA